MSRPRVFVSGPYSAPDMAVNVAMAMRAGCDLIAAGCAPHVPHLSHFLHMQEPQEYEVWMEVCFAFVEASAAVLRLPGHSPGADRECALAEQLGIPVFGDVPSLRAYLNLAAGVQRCR